MPQLVTYADAKILAQIDNTNALSIYASFVSLPLAINGLNIVNKVTQTNYATPNISYTATDAIKGSDVIDLTAIAPDIYTEDIIYFIDINLGNLDATGGGITQNIFDAAFARVGDGVKLGYLNHYNAAYGGLSSSVKFNYAGLSYTNTGIYNIRRTAILWWNVATKTAKIYADGVEVATHTFTTYSSALTSFKFRLPVNFSADTTSSLNAAYYLKKVGSFTAAEINEIVTNPYQIFKVAGATNNFSGTGVISVNNSIITAGKKSIFQPASLNVNSALTETGIKSALSSTAVNSTNTINATGFKYSESTAQINVNTATLTAGYKSASAPVSISVVNTFTVTGTAANIIKKSGTGSITAITTINSSGVKYANGSSSISVLAAIISNGYKTTSSVITDACFNTFSEAGFKSSSSSVSFSSNTTFTTLGYSNAFTPTLRSVTINGVINNSTIPGQINNSISIKGVI